MRLKTVHYSETFSGQQLAGELARRLGGSASQVSSDTWYKWRFGNLLASIQETEKMVTAVFELDESSGFEQLVYTRILREMKDFAPGSRLHENGNSNAEIGTRGLRGIWGYQTPDVPHLIWELAVGV